MLTHVGGKFSINGRSRCSNLVGLFVEEGQLTRLERSDQVIQQMTSGICSAILDFQARLADCIDTNPRTFTKQFGTFASAVAQNSAATLLNPCEDQPSWLRHPDSKTVASNVSFHLA